MTRTGIAILLLLSFAIGCNSSKPTPQPASAGPRLTDQQAAQVLKDAEAKQSCSPDNLKNATEEQKRACDPTRSMFDNIKPAAPSTNQPKKQNQRVAKQGR